MNLYELRALIARLYELNEHELIEFYERKERELLAELAIDIRKILDT